MYDFSSSVPREDTNAEKYTLRKELFGTEDVMPVWVADMDIDTPDFVLQALTKRLQHPVFGYEEVPKSAFEAQSEWFVKHHQIHYDVDDILYSHSVVASMAAVIKAFTQKGEGVIVQTPVYPPFFHSVKNLGRKVVKNPLRQREDGSYGLDIEDLKAKITPKTKLLLLCSPHNPVGRVWHLEELQMIADICKEHNIVVFSDEIHCDLVYTPNKHIPFASVSKHAREIGITAIGVGKTFNMAGFAMSSIVIPNPTLKKQFMKVYNNTHFAQGCVLSHVAFESAYRNGHLWVDELVKHLYRNYQLLKGVCDTYPHLIKITPIEATYLAWLDCRGMHLSNKELKEFFVQEAKLGFSVGVSFGLEGSGFMRLNFALSSAKMAQLIQQLEAALQRKASGKN